MPEEKVYKKFYRKADEHLNGKVEAKHGKQINQKIKPYVVLQYLLKYSDENNVLSAYDIISLLEDIGLSAERRSIYRDIEEINKVALAMEEECSIEEAEEMLFEDDSDDLKLVLYNKTKKGFYVRQRKFDLHDIRLLAECVYSAKFVSEAQAKRLVDVVCDFVSEPQAEKVKHNAFLTDRVKTNNKSVMANIATINEAMSSRLDGKPHTPEKITFKYLKYSIDDLQNQTERRKGEKYTVSPFQLLINDGNYYLLAYDDASKDMRTYRVDRMKAVDLRNIPREGEKEFEKIDLRTYTQRVFSMFGGEPKRLTLRFINPLLDTVIDRFGTKDVLYTKVDSGHFTVSAQVEISNQFFGWLCGFGNRVRIESPVEVKEEFKDYIKKIQSCYQDE